MFFQRILICGLGILPAWCAGQIVLDPTMTPSDYVQNVLLGGGVTATNITFNGQPGNLADPNQQVGSFDASAANVGIVSGVVLCSGDIDVCSGPNNDGGATIPGGGFNTPGDVDLDAISAAGTNDAAVLEFDFVPDGDTLRFNYVFGSEEYLEFVNAGYNDAFGFFLSGPGITGPYTGNAINIALVPGSTTPVAIDNVNDLVNSQFYVDNGDGFTPPSSIDPFYIQFDGFTTVLTAIAEVQCGETYHIKLAVADAGDAILDSGVFLEAGSFSSPAAFSVSFAAVSANGDLTEGCTEAELVITRPDTVGDLVINLTVGGTATSGIDYSAIPSAVIIPSGSTSITLPLDAFQDNITEGTETIIFTSFYINGCNDTTYITATLDIVEYQPIVLQASPDLFLNCDQDSVLVGASASGGYQNLSFLWSTSSATTSTWVPGLVSGSYTVTVSDECMMSASAVVNVNNGCEIIIPNVFSPNGDGSNDKFVIEGILGTDNTVRIFNRWGQVIFEATNYRNTWRATDVSEGTYYYEVTVKGKNKPFTGHLTLLR